VTLSALPRTVLRGLVRGYQLVISPWTPPSCRYYPSCSQYALVALERHGALRGSWLALRRLGRCHPWTAGGVDDVPPAREPHRTRTVGSSGAVPPTLGAPTVASATARAGASPLTSAAAGGPTVCTTHADRARSSAR
jgi:putative membrane protein insertion efficiency factor